MTTYSKLTISGNEVLDSDTYSVYKSISDNNSSSTFEAYINNYAGVNGSRYNIGEEVVIYADMGTNPPTTTIFTGILEDIKFEGKSDLDDIVVLSGRDYSARLMDRTVQPEVYTNWEIGSIVRDIVSKYVDGVSYSGVQNTGVILNRISFNQTPVYDAIKQLQALAGDYMFYVDVNKDLKFELASTTSSGYTFNSGNTVDAQFTSQRDTVFNQVWVYGDRYLDGFKETFTAGSPLGGSVFTLLYKPSNTEITASGVLIQPGGILGMTNTPTSGAKYLVSYDDRQIIFTSGTDIGDNVPASGVPVVINYQRLLPIVKVGDNEVSKAMYGTRVKVIVDKDIKDPNTAQDIMITQLADNSFPKTEGNITVRNVVNVTPGNTAVVNLPFYNVDNETYDIIEASYEFSKPNNLEDEVLTLKLNQKINDFTDTFKQALLDIKKLQAGDISNTDTITRFQYTTGSVGVRQSGALVYTRPINDTYILGHPINGVLGVVNPNSIGSIVGAGVAWVTGAGIGYDRALSFPGSSAGYVYCGNGSETMPTDKVSISCWINVDKPFQFNSFPSIVSRERNVAPTGSRNGWQLIWSSGTIPSISFEVFNNGNSSTAGSQLPNFISGVWHNIVGTYESGTNNMRLYMNGSLIRQATPSASASTIGYNPSGLFIGADTNGASEFAGDIDDVRIYNRVVSGTEIGSLYAKQNVLGGLVAYYKFDEGAGSFAYNSASVEMPTNDSLLYYRFNQSGTVFLDQTGNTSGVGISGITMSTGVYGNGSSILAGSPGYVALSTSTYVRPTGTMSLSAWINCTPITSGPILSYGDPNFGAWSYWLKADSLGNSNRPAFEANINGVTQSVNGGTLPSNGWTNIIGTYDQLYLRLYINGSIIGSTSAPGSITYPFTSDFRIGRALIGGYYLSNSIDEVRLYNRTLTGSEILSLYQGKTIQPLLGDRRGPLTLVWSGAYLT